MKEFIVYTENTCWLHQRIADFGIFNIEKRLTIDVKKKKHCVFNTALTI